MINRNNLAVVFLSVIFFNTTPITAAENGSARFVVTSDLLVAGMEIVKGQYKVTWESTDGDTDVTFKPIGKDDGITVKGKIEQVPNKYSYNNLAVGMDATGRKVIKQLQFAGKNIRIVF